MSIRTRLLILLLSSLPAATALAGLPKESPPKAGPKLRVSFRTLNEAPAPFNDKGNKLILHKVEARLVGPRALLEQVASVRWGSSGGSNRSRTSVWIPAGMRVKSTAVVTMRDGSILELPFHGKADPTRYNAKEQELTEKLQNLTGDLGKSLAAKRDIKDPKTTAMLTNVARLYRAKIKAVRAAIKAVKGEKKAASGR